MATTNTPNDNEQFYSEVARGCSKSNLDSEETDTAFRARLAAVKSFEQHGATVPPSPDLVYSVSWLLTQSRLTQERTEAREAVALIEAVIATKCEQRERIIALVDKLQSDPEPLKALQIRRQCGLYESDADYLDAIDTLLVA